VDVPDVLDLEHLRGRGPQLGEALQPDAPAEPAAAAAGASAAAPPPPLAPDAATVAALVGMGFSENGSKRAALATQARRPPGAGPAALGACRDGIWCRRRLLGELCRGRECEPAAGTAGGSLQ